MIATVMPPPGEPIPGMRPHLVLKLRPGWRLDTGANGFIDARGRTCPEKEELPSGTKLQPVSATLQRKRTDRLSAPERDLVRYFQIVFPTGADPRTYLDLVKRWPCVAEVTLPPTISLPQDA